jgi:hypothetical protein
MTTDHGTRADYKRGCRCLPCRVANATYRPASRRVLIPADASRAHLLALEANGLGREQVAKLSGLSAMHVYRVRSGAIARVCPETEQRILAVKPVPALGALVPSWPCRRLLDQLRREGFQRRDLAERYGIPRRTPPRRRVRVSTALRVRAACAVMEIGAEEVEA